MNTIKNANRDNILEIVKSQLANAGEYTFYFVGNVDVETLKPLVEQYIASIPGKAVPAAKITTAGLGLKTGSATELLLKVGRSISTEPCRGQCHRQVTEIKIIVAAIAGCTTLRYSSEYHLVILCHVA